MHPNKAFEWTDQAAMLRFAEERAFAHIFTASADGLFVVHAPVMVTERKYVRKSRNAAPGAVMVEREDVLMVEPRLPT